MAGVSVAFLRRMYSRLTHPRIFPFLFLFVFALTLATLFRAEGVDLDRLSVLVASIAAFTAVMSVIKSQEAVEVSKGLLDEAIRQRQINTTPHVVAWLEPSSKVDIACDMILKNVGTATAYDVTVDFVSGGEDYTDRDKFLLLIINQGVKVMVPGREVREIFGGVQFMKDYPFTVSVSYSPTNAPNSLALITECFVMNPWEGSGQSVERDDIKELKSIVTQLKRMNDRHREPLRLFGEPEHLTYRLRRAVREFLDGIAR